MRRLQRTLLILCTVLSGGCVSYFPSAKLPVSVPREQEVKVVTIPLPVIATTPNEGVTWGALTAFLLHNEKDEVATLIAPQVNRNKNFGTTASIYGAFYPSPQRSWEANLSKSSKVNQDYELRVRDESLMAGKLEVNGFIYLFTDGSARFFGLRSDSLSENETNFGDREYGLTLSAGYPVVEHTKLFVGERVRQVEIVEGAVKAVPFTRDVFTGDELPGGAHFTAHAQSISLVYNTLDAFAMPTSGMRARMTVENSLEALGGNADYRRYELEWKGFFPVQEARYITACRAAYSQALGKEVPFLERSILGGESTLRGYGRNRFIDSSYILVNLEERIRLFRWEVFGVRADWELTPFLDIGGVMESLPDLTAGDLEVNPGLGFRAVVRPNIVGRIDVGFSRDGAAVFVGLGYPF